MENTTALALNMDRLMRRIHAKLHPRASSFDFHNVGPLGGMLLLTIGEREPVDSKTIVEALGRDKSQISRLIQSLERKSLISRRKSEDDGRLHFLTLTEIGHEQLNQIKEALSKVIDDIFTAASDDERNQLNTIINKVLTS